MPRQTSTQSSVPESEDAAYHGLFSENGSASNPMRHWQATALKTENDLELIVIHHPAQTVERIKRVTHATLIENAGSYTLNLGEHGITQILKRGLNRTNA